jgi:hypothetical protein
MTSRIGFPVLAITSWGQPVSRCFGAAPSACVAYRYWPRNASASFHLKRGTRRQSKASARTAALGAISAPSPRSGRRNRPSTQWRRCTVPRASRKTPVLHRSDSATLCLDPSILLNRGTSVRCHDGSSGSPARCRRTSAGPSPGRSRMTGELRLVGRVPGANQEVGREGGSILRSIGGKPAIPQRGPDTCASRLSLQDSQVPRGSRSSPGGGMLGTVLASDCHSVVCTGPTCPAA